MSRPAVVEAAKTPSLRGYVLRRLRIPVGSVVVSIVVPDAADWRRRGRWTAAVERGGEPPYWTRVWLAGVAAARWLARIPDLAVASVCDLGCGLGLPGITSAGRGARVTFVDREPDAVAFAAWNAERQAGCGPVCARPLDWGRGELLGSFQVIVLSDVTYNELHHRPLLHLIDQCLAANGLVLHTDPMREEAGRFLALLGREYPSAVCRRATTLGDDSADIRLCLAARSRCELKAWRDRGGGDLAWEASGR